jgi:hypothetical protein
MSTTKKAQDLQPHFPSLEKLQQELGGSVPTSVEIAVADFPEVGGQIEPACTDVSRLRISPWVAIFHRNVQHYRQKK